MKRTRNLAIGVHFSKDPWSDKDGVKVNSESDSRRGAGEETETMTETWVRIPWDRYDNAFVRGGEKNMSKVQE